MPGDAAMAPGADNALLEVLARSQQLGLIGGALAEQIRHAERFGTVLEGLRAAGSLPTPALGLDLGSGGGLPGLVLARRSNAISWVLLDSMRRRTAILEDHVARLGLGGQVQVVCARAEVAGRSQRWRGRFDVVVARSFGPAAATAECAAPLLREGGYLAVSEPPDSEGARWPVDELASLGLRPLDVAEGVMLLRQEAVADDRWPRRVGLPQKRPLF